MKGGSDLCQLCPEGEVEDQEHFMKDCQGLRHMRNGHCVTEDVLQFGERREEDVKLRMEYLLDVLKKKDSPGRTAKLK